MNVITYIILAIFAVVLFIYGLPRNHTQQQKSRKLLISLGSGGHTTEMLLMLQTIDVWSFQRIYYITAGDSLSSRHATDFEARLKPSQDEAGAESAVRASASVTRTLPRARKVGQSWSSTVFTTLRSLISAIYWIHKDKPDMLICNGPGTCVMLAFAALFFRFMRIKHCRIIFIESFARVKRLSLSGKILIHFADRFLVMWPELAQQYEKAEYASILI